MISSEDETKLRRVGLECASPACLLPALEALVASATTGAILARIETRTFARVHAASMGREWDLLAELGSNRARDAEASARRSDANSARALDAPAALTPVEALVTRG